MGIRKIVHIAAYVEGDPHENFQAGNEYFFRLQTGSWAKEAVGRAEMKLLALPKEQGTDEIKKLKEGRVTQRVKTLAGVRHGRIDWRKIAITLMISSSRA